MDAASFHCFVSRTSCYGQLSNTDPSPYPKDTKRTISASVTQLPLLGGHLTLSVYYESLVVFTLVLFAFFPVQATSSDTNCPARRSWHTTDSSWEHTSSQDHFRRDVPHLTLLWIQQCLNSFSWRIQITVWWYRASCKGEQRDISPSWFVSTGWP